MTKSADRRSIILDKLADYVLSEGLSASSLRPLAKAAGISDRMLLYYFRDKAEVIAATLERISLRLVTLMSERTAATPLPFEELRAKLQAIVLADEFWPYMCVWLEVAAMAARNDPLYRVVGERIGRGFLEWGKSQLCSATPEAQEVEAARLFVTLEGSVVLKSIGLADICRNAR